MLAAGGDLEGLRAAVRMANQDWRELASSAGTVGPWVRQLLGSDYVPHPALVRQARNMLMRAAILGLAFALSAVFRWFSVSTSTAALVLGQIAVPYGVTMAMNLWRDRYFREHSGFRGAVAMGAIGVVQVGIVAALGTASAALLVLAVG